MKKSNAHEHGFSDGIIDVLRSLALNPNRDIGDVGLKQGEKQILMVTRHGWISSNWLNMLPKSTGSVSLLILEGYPTSDSHPELKRAIINFVDDAMPVPAPCYSRASGLIQLSLRYRELPTVVALLSEISATRGVCCWIGNFWNEQLYGEIETTIKSPKRKT